VHRERRLTISKSTTPKVRLRIAEIRVPIGVGGGLIAVRTAIDAKLIRDAVRRVRAAGTEGIGD